VACGESTWCVHVECACGVVMRTPYSITGFILGILFNEKKEKEGGEVMNRRLTISILKYGAMNVTITVREQFEQVPELISV
jgi:hypothetical protein